MTPPGPPTAAADVPPTSAAAPPLSQRSLRRYTGQLSLPTYDRSALVPSVVHLSVGGFSRAHQLSYFDELAERGLSTEWGVVGVGLRSRTMKEALAPQDHLYTVVERSPDGERARVIGVLVDYHFAPDDPSRVLDVLTDERTRMVTMTITDAGYRVDHATASFDADDDDVRWDLTRPDLPRTVFGFLVEALDRRRRAGTPPFTVVSCDNVHRNGDVARSAVVGFARLRDEVLARWIADRVSFPCSMVDRITPHTAPEEREAVARRYGLHDRWPVITEPFSQWFIEDDFCNGRPPLDEVGVQFVADVDDYELVKTRLLNASHCALGYLGSLAGYTSIDQLMVDDLFVEYATGFLEDEAGPLVPEPDGIDLELYKRMLLLRFANPSIADGLDRLCRRGSAKMPLHVLPTLRQALDTGRPYALLSLAVAAWFRYLAGRTDDGRPIEVEDPAALRLQHLARLGGTDPRPLLGERRIFGDLGDDPRVVARLASLLERLEATGVRAVLADELAERRIAPAAPAVDGSA
jgi:fructuronate reductase/mannitol 2-dehydrogenase